MFSDCRVLAELNVTGFDTSEVTNMSHMFHSCQVLKEIDVTGFNTGKVTDMSKMFEWSLSLKSLDLRNFDFDQVTDFNEIFDALGRDAVNKPINILVTQEQYDILKDKETGINPEYSTLVIVP